jgi:hypothetical protein
MQIFSCGFHLIFYPVFRYSATLILFPKVLCPGSFLGFFNCFIVGD